MALGTAASLVAVAAGCTYSHGDPAPACDVARETITYSAVVAPIFAANCLRCHGSTVANVIGGGNDFGSYAALSRYPQNSLLGSVRHEAGYSPMPQNSSKLSDCDIKRLEAWYAQGKPQ
ncbi:hypothetical protein GCM10022409_26190 [Hymenobacter glaciei]|uniref:Cytochrome c domain-containing protein n=1 Tax=Hymenobacter glaciei TaxID=877209 RepID=A0ABP7UB76_9BACT